MAIINMPHRTSVASGGFPAGYRNHDREAQVPRYFFDFHDGEFHGDDHGTQCADLEAARREAMLTLPEIARFAIPADGDDQAFTMSVRDESGTAVYTATLTFAGTRLDSVAEPEPLD